MTAQKLIMVCAALLGLAFFGLAAMYWMTPAGSLPTYVPGFIPGSTDIHFKHGLASLMVGLALFVLAWFKSAPVQRG